MRAVVIGAGVVGCAVGLELRHAGFDVTVVDKNGDVGHGSTSASCGIVRRFYAQPGMIAMAHEGAHIWDDWPAYVGDIDDDLITFHRPGMLFIPPRMDAAVRATVEEMQKIGIRVSILDAQDISQRFPFLDALSQYPPRPVNDPEFFTLSDRKVEGGVFEEDAGYVVYPALAAQNLRRAGEREGVVYRLHHQITGIRRTGSGPFTLETATHGILESDVVVNVSGPHSGLVYRLAGVTLPLETRPLRREVHALRNPLKAGGQPGRAGDVSRAGNLPVVGDLDAGIYFRPDAGGRDLIVGSTDPQCDALEFVDDPDHFDRTVTPLYHERQCLRLMKRFPQVRLGPSRGVADLYDVTVQDWYPIADCTDLPGYYVCIGTSGSSFKTAPVLGKLMAGLIQAVESGRDIDTDPFQLPLQHIGLTVDSGFLSRLRGSIRTSGTVIG
jgi:sarcosine oxidase subunit beta